MRLLLYCVLTTNPYELAVVEYIGCCFLYSTSLGPVVDYIMSVCSGEYVCLDLAV